MAFHFFYDLPKILNLTLKYYHQILQVDIIDKIWPIIFDNFFLPTPAKLWTEEHIGEIKPGDFIEGP